MTTPTQFPTVKIGTILESVDSDEITEILDIYFRWSPIREEIRYDILVRLTNGRDSDTFTITPLDIILGVEQGRWTIV